MDEIKASALASSHFKANPYPFYARLRAEAPAFRLKWVFGQMVWLVVRYDDAVMVLRDERFANNWIATTSGPFRLSLRLAGPIARTLLNTDPPDHTRLRTLVHKAFTPRLIERLRERIQAVCDELLDDAAPEGRANLVRAYALPLPLTIIAELLGIPAQDRLRFHSWSRAMLAVSSSIDVLRTLPTYWRVIRYFRGLFAQRRLEPRDDLVTALVQAEEAGDKLTEEELVSMVFLLLIAGYETTVNLIAGGALALIQDPEQRNRLRDNPSLAEPAVEELLRYTSPIEITSPRVARERVSMGSISIAPGELVAAVLGSANHDESQFPDPDTLDIAREPNKHVAFGQGSHFCLGASLARLEGQIALTTLLRRLPKLRLAERGSPRWRRSPVLRGLEELPVAFD